MAGPVPLKITVDRTADLAKALRRLANMEVMVGVPSDDEQPHVGARHTEERDGTDTIGNAALLYIHETGSPVNNIPARPSLEPGVRDSADDWIPHLKRAGIRALQGDANGSDKGFMAAGQTAVSAVKRRITAGIPPPLKPATIRARRKRSPGSSYRRKAQVAADVTPLIDTAQMINSISYVLRHQRK